jgi:hypothetical protein
MAELQCPLCAHDKCQPLAVEYYFHCQVCDLRFLDPPRRLGPSDEKSRYDLHNNSPTDPRYRDFLRPLLTAMSERLEVGAEGLDFGTGPTPVLAQMFVQHGFPTLAYDPFFWPDTACLKRTYDFIVASEVAEHFYSPLHEFSKLLKLLKP